MTVVSTRHAGGDAHAEDQRGSRARRRCPGSWPARGARRPPIRRGRGRARPRPGARAGTSRRSRGGRARYRSRGRADARGDAGARGSSSSCAWRCACGCPCIGAGGVTRSVSWRRPPVRLRMPSAMSMSATANSIASPTGGGITTLKAMIATPTTTTVTVWPRPHSAPIRVRCAKRRLRLRIVVTAMTWSASVAWRMPSRNPNPASARNWVTGSSPCRRLLQLVAITASSPYTTGDGRARIMGVRSAMFCAVAGCAGRPSARRSSTSWPRRTATSPARSSSSAAAPAMRGRPRRPCTARSTCSRASDSCVTATVPTAGRSSTSCRRAGTATFTARRAGRPGRSTSGAARPSRARCARRRLRARHRPRHARRPLPAAALPRRAPERC